MRNLTYGLTTGEVVTAGNGIYSLIYTKFYGIPVDGPYGIIIVAISTISVSHVPRTECYNVSVALTPVKFVYANGNTAVNR